MCKDYKLYWVALLVKDSCQAHSTAVGLLRGGGTMGCQPMVTKNANFVTNALRGDLSTVNVRPCYHTCTACHHTCSLHQWIGNRILPKFYPRMSSLALLEPEIPSPLDITGQNNGDILLASLVAVAAFPLCMAVVEVMVVRMVPCLKRGRHRMTP